MRFCHFQDLLWKRTNLTLHRLPILKMVKKHQPTGQMWLFLGPTEAEWYIFGGSKLYHFYIWSIFDWFVRFFYFGHLQCKYPRGILSSSSEGCIIWLQQKGPLSTEWFCRKMDVNHDLKNLRRNLGKISLLPDLGGQEEPGVDIRWPDTATTLPMQTCVLTLCVFSIYNNVRTGSR